MLGTLRLHLANAPITPDWSKPWYVPVRSGYMAPVRRALVMQSTRLPSASSTTRPGRMLATPGPLLAMHTPSRPVMRAYAAAAWAPLASCRGVISSMPSRFSAV